MELPFLRNVRFTGRQKELIKIHEVLKGRDSDPSHLRVAVLHGLGGMGKTQLTNQYAYLHEKDYSSIWWVNAKTVEALSQSFLGICQGLIAYHARIKAYAGQKPDYISIATILGLAPDDINLKGQLKTSADSAERIVDAVKSWLTTAARESYQWLLIIDNYDDLETVGLQDFLPTNSPGSIIITTRSRDARRLGSDIEVAEVEHEDAVEILRKSARTEMVDFDRGEYELSW